MSRAYTPSDQGLGTSSSFQYNISANALRNSTHIHSFSKCSRFKDLDVRFDLMDRLVRNGATIPYLLAYHLELLASEWENALIRKSEALIVRLPICTLRLTISPHLDAQIIMAALEQKIEVDVRSAAISQDVETQAMRVLVPFMM